MKLTIIMAIASMHQIHKDHPTFNYNALFHIVDDFHPDYVGVEIRPEDIDTDTIYLEQNYPYEMIELSKRYGDGQCFGFDWLGEDIDGQPIPSNYWKEISAYKRLERELSEDVGFNSDELDGLFEQQMDIAKSATPAALLDGRYDAVTKRYYQIGDALLRGTKYELISKFRHNRDLKISQNIVNFIHKHPGTRIALVMGANHHAFVLETLSIHFGSEHVLYEQPNLK
jgi:hypothetical protein